MNQPVAVFGASGFVGSAVSEALRLRGHQPISVRTPRLASLMGGAPSSAQEALDAYADEIDALIPQLAEVRAVVNCAGDPDASSRDVNTLNRANGDIVAVLAEATTRAAAPRFVHVSSAVVQGRRPVLDESFDYDPFSAYAQSKIRGEQFIVSTRPAGSVIYRPPSVHAPGRRVTQLTRRIAQSPLSSVADPPDSPTPQALLPNVADAVALLATCDQEPPLVVIHPWEGMTTAGLLRSLGGREPRVLSRRVAEAVTATGTAIGRISPRAAANMRRVEMIWLGQPQAESWLTSQGWIPPLDWAEQKWPS